MAQIDPVERESMPPNAEKTIKIKVVLDNIRSLYNVGSIFRTSDGFGVDELLLCGITSTPQNPRFSKTSLGAEEHVRWSYSPNAVDTCRKLIEQGYNLFALEKTDDSIPLYEIKLENCAFPIALVVGNEVIGVDPGVLKICPQVISIPMVGHKSSFNVATAYGIAISYFYAGSLQ
jgi:tRNA G18 (ribose-2'-O)-methylase SpoU